MKKLIWLSFLKIGIDKYNGFGMAVQFFGGRVFFFRTPNQLFQQYVRILFPYFLIRGLRCCDHGGQVVNSYPWFAWNKWHWDSIAKDDWGDGPDVWHSVNLFHWLEYKRERKERLAA